jgi:hypothetical protein
MLHERAEHVDTVQKVYREGKVPLGMLAAALGSDLVLAWQGVLAGNLGGLACTSGTLADVVAETRRVQVTDEVVADLTALLTACHFELADVLSQEFSSIFVPQQARDEVHGLLVQSERYDSQMSMVVWEENGRLFRREVTSAERKARRDFLANVMKFIDDSCHIVGLEAPFPAHLQEVPKLIGPAQACVLLLASQRSLPLLADDLPLRLLAQGEFQVQSFDSSAVVWAMQAGPRRRAELLAKLLGAGYRTIAFDAQVLWAAARLAGFRLAPPFDRALREIEDAVGQRPAKTGLVAEFLDLLLSELIVLPDITAGWLVNAVLDAATRNESATLRLLEAIRRRVKLQFRLRPAEADQAAKIIASWEQGALLT